MSGSTPPPPISGFGGNSNAPQPPIEKPPQTSSSNLGANGSTSSSGNFVPPPPPSTMPTTSNTESTPNQNTVPPVGNPVGKPGNKKKPAPNKMIIIIIAIAVLSIAALVGIGALVVSMINSSSSQESGQVESSDPNLGIWQGAAIDAFGMQMPINDIFASGASIELFDDGSTTITFDGESEDGTWTLDGTNLSVTYDGVDVSGSIVDGVLMLINIQDTGMDIYFTRDGIPPDFIDFEVEESSDTESSTNPEESSETESSTEPEESSEAEIVTDPALGYWDIYSIILDGEEVDIPTAYPDGFSIELLEGGEALLIEGATVTYATWYIDEYDILNITDGDFSIMGSAVDDFLTVTDMDTMTTFMFVKEGSDILTGGVDTGDDFVSSTTSIEINSYWYGSMTITNYTGIYDLGGVYDIWGYVVDSESGPYFEIYTMGETEDIYLFSSYITLYDDSFETIATNGDAWVMDRPLGEEDEIYFSPTLENGALIMDYHYIYEEEEYNLQFFLREEMTDWDLENDPLPPSM